MRERVDCTWLVAAGNTHSQTDVLAAGSYLAGRLMLSHYQVTAEAVSGAVVSSPVSHCVLADNAMALRRYDAVLISVSPATLAWARQLLSASKGYVSTPIIAIVSDLKAAALNDLFALGVADVLRTPVCLEELRFRVHCKAQSASHVTLAEPYKPGFAVDPVQVTTDSVNEEVLSDSILGRSGTELDAFAVAAAAAHATSKQSFRAAKAKIIERFEKAYINASLLQHGGNIAMAARCSKKHRRAYWALMRKYNIDAGPYRSGPGFNPAPDG
jgi:CheY-like chemotaxis protein